MLNKKTNGALSSAINFPILIFAFLDLPAYNLPTSGTFMEDVFFLRSDHSVPEDLLGVFLDENLRFLKVKLGTL